MAPLLYILHHHFIGHIAKAGREAAAGLKVPFPKAPVSVGTTIRQSHPFLLFVTSTTRIRPFGRSTRRSAPADYASVLGCSTDRAEPRFHDSTPPCVWSRD
jgi:hypothetical protein